MELSGISLLFFKFIIHNTDKNSSSGVVVFLALRVSRHNREIERRWK